MKSITLCSIIVSGLFLIACNSTPSIDEVENAVKDGVEALLTEDNNADKHFRMDRFFLSENPEPLVYTGTLKTTCFYKNPTGEWDRRNLRFIATLDSLKMYRKVTIKFRDKKYDYYTIEIAAPE